MRYSLGNEEVEKIQNKSAFKVFERVEELYSDTKIDSEEKKEKVQEIVNQVVEVETKNEIEEVLKKRYYTDTKNLFMIGNAIFLSLILLMSILDAYLIFTGKINHEQRMITSNVIYFVAATTLGQLGIAYRTLAKYIFTYK